MNEALLTGFQRLPEWKPLLASLKNAGCTAVCELPEGEVPFLAAALWRQTHRCVVIICPTERVAQRHAQDAERVFGLKSAVLPAQEIQFTRAATSRESTWKRLSVLDDMAHNRLDVVCAQVDALQFRAVPGELFRESCTDIREGQIFSPKKLMEKLIRVGYENVAMVEGQGQCAMRGSIVDVFPSNQTHAVRIEFFDDEVDTLRQFDCISQRSILRMKEIHIAPATECILTDCGLSAARLSEALSKDITPLTEEDEQDSLPSTLCGAEDFLNALDCLETTEDLLAGTQPPTNTTKKNIQKKVLSPADDKAEATRRAHLTDVETVKNGGVIRTAPMWMNVLCENTVQVMSYLKEPVVLFHRPDEFNASITKAQTAFEDALNDAMRRGDGFEAQRELRYTYDELLAYWQGLPSLALSETINTYGRLNPSNAYSLDAKTASGYQSQMKQLAGDLRLWREKQLCTVLLMGGEARAKRMVHLLAEEKIPSVYSETLDGNLIASEVLVLPVSCTHGFVHEAAGLCVLSDSDIYGTAYQRAKGRHVKQGERIASFTDLKVGDYVVHDLHGIGIYQGLVQLSDNGLRRDFLQIDYAGRDKLYVPADQFDRVNKFIGNEQSLPKLSTLGTGEWTKQKNKVRAGLKELAFSLAELYGRRQKSEGYAFSKDTPFTQEFGEQFPYDLTEDQQKSLAEIEADMESPHNMDRLLCGDVGYGKTEVAMRAAFKALMDGKQVAMLAPTTVLVQQHYNTIRKRFQGFPVRCDMLSRFRTSREITEIERNLATGELDFVVGTHKLLGKGIKFHNLGLLIVDEEQRFGVGHKEKIQNMKNQLDVLTLSATPIPRTLHMSLSGIRDMSVLETPPEERLPVKTYVTEYNDAVIRDAIRREMSRGGQVFFLYNRVSSMEQMHERLKALVPEARICIAHGQMRENALEDIMLDFYAGAYDVLLCTTIIESGLDVPDANTLIVFDADRFGLSQLYQIRGRVGRSNRQAYAYLTVRPDKSLNETAQQRLSAIREFTEFGAGYRIAMRDMEIRGAGDVLGPQQSGHMEAIGYDMYLKLIEEAINSAKGNETIPELDTRVDITLDAYLPETYVQQEKLRVEMYKRIAMIENREDQNTIEEELVDRFGDIPQPAVTLMNIARLRAVTRKLGISRVYLKQDGVHMRFDAAYMPKGDIFYTAIFETDKRLRIEKTSMGYELILAEKGMYSEKAVRLCNDVMGRVLDSYREKSKEEKK